MRTRILWALSASVVAAACGGSNGTGLDGLDGGGPDGSTGPQDGATPVDGASGSDSGVGRDTGSPADGGGASCDGGTIPCGGACVDPSNDPQNCGGCGIPCNTTCTNGVCPLIAPDAGTPPTVGDNACLTVDAANVYWGTGTAGGSVWRVSIAGGVPAQVASGQTSPHPMASDGTTLFFGDQGTAGTCSGSIQSIAVGATNGTPAPIATGQCAPLDVVVDATTVYWTNSGDGSVWKSDKTTPNPVNLVPAAGLGHALYLRVDSANVYFTDGAGGVLDRVPIGGGAVTAVTTTGIPGPGHLAIDGVNAYFSSRSTTSAALLAVALGASGGSPSQIVTNLPALNGIQTDGTDVWFAEATNVVPYRAGTGEIHRVTTAGAGGALLASGQNGPNCIAVDATSVYWIDTGGGTISKTGK
jgi:hypothetical protein